MLLQNVRRGDEEHLHRDRVRNYHRFSVRAWDIYDDPRRKGRRYGQILTTRMTFVQSVRIAQPLPQIPLDAYHLCVFFRHRNLELAYTSLSIIYGTRVSSKCL
jgi:hypothetical protein